MQHGALVRYTVLLLFVVVWIAKEDARRSFGVDAVAMYEDEDDYEDDEDDEFDFMSTKLEFAKTKERSERQEAECDAATGECSPSSASVIRSVVERGLVTTKPLVADLLKHHAHAATNQQERAFQGETLGYVTPWNGRGYDWAKQFQRKFTYIAPVWLQIREDPKVHAPIITGTHDIDAEWIEAVRGSDGLGPKLVPRIVYERNQLASDDIPTIIKDMLGLARKHHFDGYVMEIPVNARTADFLYRVGQALQEASLLMLVVLQQSSQTSQWSVPSDVLQALDPVVHRFSMNAYDFQQPGPNAPLPWIRETLLRADSIIKDKILMGIPFYGYDNQNAVTGTAYIDSLTQHHVVKLRWDAQAHECFHAYTASDNSPHRVYYPCLQFLHDRLRLYEQHHVGAAIWEIGQGLDFFADLL